MHERLTQMLPYLTTLAGRYRSGCTTAGFDPEDLAQEAILRALEKYGDNLPTRESDLLRFLHKIMARFLYDALDKARAQKRGGGRVGSLDEILGSFAESTIRLDAFLLSNQPGPRTAAQRSDARRLVSAEIQALPRRNAQPSNTISSMTSPLRKLPPSWAGHPARSEAM